MVQRLKIYASRLPECHILVPQEYLGNVMTLCIERRGVQKDMNSWVIKYRYPLKFQWQKWLWISLIN